MDSILSSVKLAIPIPEDCTDFDSVLISEINDIFPILNQMGVGPASGFHIDSDTQTWSDYISAGILQDLVRSYVGKKVKLSWDPPTNGSVMEALERTVSNLEGRIILQVEDG